MKAVRWILILCLIGNPLSLIHSQKKPMDQVVKPVDLCALGQQIALSNEKMIRMESEQDGPTKKKPIWLPVHPDVTLSAGNKDRVLFYCSTGQLRIDSLVKARIEFASAFAVLRDCEKKIHPQAPDHQRLFPRVVIPTEKINAIILGPPEPDVPWHKIKCQTYKYSFTVWDAAGNETHVDPHLIIIE